MGAELAPTLAFAIPFSVGLSMSQISDRLVLPRFIRANSKQLLQTAEAATATGVHQHVLRSGELVPRWGTGQDTRSMMNGVLPPGKAMFRIFVMWCIISIFVLFDFKGIFQERELRLAADRHPVYYVSGFVFAIGHIDFTRKKGLQVSNRSCVTSGVWNVFDSNDLMNSILLPLDPSSTGLLPKAVE